MASIDYELYCDVAIIIVFVIALILFIVAIKTKIKLRTIAICFLLVLACYIGALALRGEPENGYTLSNGMVYENGEIGYK